MRTILLQQPDMAASTSFLAEEIAKRGLYERKDGEVARARQINARARNYAELFEFTEPLKQIQFLLGHDKLDTTARYVNDEQKFGGEAGSKVADIS